MAATTWIVKLENHYSVDVHIEFGEDPSQNRTLKPKQSLNTHGTRMCFPWVDANKPTEMSKVIKIRTHLGDILLWQSWNLDQILEIKIPDGQAHCQPVATDGHTVSNGSPGTNKRLVIGGGFVTGNNALRVVIEDSAE